MSEGIFTPEEKTKLGEMMEQLAKEMAENPIVTQYEMTFPVEIEGVDVKVKPVQKGLSRTPIGTLVKLRLASKEDTKTYVGMYMGELIAGVLYAFRPKTKHLDIVSHNNPAIFVPELKRIVWGMECWWSEIENEDDVKDITDADIDNVWYVKLLKAQLTQNNESEV